MMDDPKLRIITCFDAMRANLTASEKIRILAIVKSVYAVDVESGGNWKYKHAILGRVNNIEEIVGPFPGHNDDHASSNDWKDLFNNIYSNLSDADIDDAVECFLKDEAVHHIKYTDFFGSVINVSAALISVWRILLLKEEYYDTVGKGLYETYCDAVSKSEYILSEERFYEACKWLIPLPIYEREYDEFLFNKLQMTKQSDRLLACVGVVAFRKIEDQTTWTSAANALSYTKEKTTLHMKLQHLSNWAERALISREQKNLFDELYSILKNYSVINMLREFAPSITSPQPALDVLEGMDEVDILLQICACIQVIEGNILRFREYEKHIAGLMKDALSKVKFNDLWCCIVLYKPVPSKIIANKKLTNVSKLLAQVGVVDTNVVAEMFADMKNYPSEISNPYLYIQRCKENKTGSKKEDGSADTSNPQELVNLYKEIHRTVVESNYIDLLRRIEDNCQDFQIENSVIYERFARRVQGKIRKKVLIVNPNYEFIRIWNSDVRVSECSTRFAVETDSIARYMAIGSQNNNDYISFEELDLVVEKKNKYDEILIFARGLSTDKTTSLITSLVIKILPDGYVCALVPDVLFTGREAPLDRKNIFENCDCTDVFIIPSQFVGSTPKKKLLVNFIPCSQNSKSCIAKVSSFDQPVENQQYLKHIDGTDIDYCCLRRGAATNFRKLLSDAKQRPDRPQRELPKCFEFSREIKIFYTITYLSGQNIYRAKAYVCEFPTQKQQKRNKLCRGKAIPDSYSYFSDDSELVLIKIVEDNAAFNSKIRNAIAPRTLKMYAKDTRIGLSLKTFWYCREDNLKEIPSYDREKACILFTAEGSERLGNCMLNEATYDDYAECMSEVFDRNCIIEKSKQQDLWRQLGIILQGAMTQGYLYASKNPVSEYISTFTIRDKGFQEVRNALVKKSLTVTEERNLLSWISARIPENGDVIGVAIRFYTGMEPDEICALKWSDYKKFAHTDVYHLDVSKKANDLGNTIMPLGSKERYRVIPVSSELKSMISLRLNYLKKQGLSKEKLDYDELYIVSDANNYEMPCLPKRLRAVSKNALVDGAKIPKNLISVPTEFGGIKETDLNQYQGDYFKSNFKYRALNTCDMTMGEMSYVIGIQAPDTFSKHYCDFTNEFSQLEIFTKLNRWISFRNGAKAQPNLVPFTIKDGSEEYTAKACSSGKTTAEIVLEIQKISECAVVEIEIDSKFGVAGEIISVRK